MVAAVTSQLKFKPVQDNFIAEVEGLDFSEPIPEAVRDELLAGIRKYGVVVARGTTVTDDTMISLGRQWGELDNITAHKKAGRKMRLPQDEIFDVGNIDPDNNIISETDTLRMSSARGNALFHADGAYNPRRSGISILRAVELPPPGTGGETEFVDSRTAYEELPDETKEKIKDLVGLNTLLWNRKQANPDMDMFKDIDCTKVPLAKHKLAQIHEPTGRGNLYVGSYNHHIEGMDVQQGRKLIDELLAHMTQAKYRQSVFWESPGDITFWDNTAVLHRATVGKYNGQFRRDMRRISTFDDSSWAYGENDPTTSKQVGLQ